jgi:hypothetical protein
MKDYKMPRRRTTRRKKQKENGEDDEDDDNEGEGEGGEDNEADAIADQQLNGAAAMKRYSVRGCLHVRFCVRIGVRFAANGIRKVNFLFFLLKCVDRQWCCGVLFLICPLKDGPNLKCPLLSFKGRDLSFSLPFTPILQSKLVFLTNFFMI